VLWRRSLQPKKKCCEELTAKKGRREKGRRRWKNVCEHEVFVGKQVVPTVKEVCEARKVWATKEGLVVAKVGSVESRGYYSNRNPSAVQGNRLRKQGTC